WLDRQLLDRRYAGRRCGHEGKERRRRATDPGCPGRPGQREREVIMSFTRTLLRMVAVGALALTALAGPAQAKTLRVGITLHPYYSFVANIVGDRAKIIPLIDSDANPHGYAPQPADMIRMQAMDVMVVNGIGHDTWAFEILD